MSKIKRSTYQKVVEENKRLKTDLKALVCLSSLDEYAEVQQKWLDYFTEKETFERSMKEYSRKYFNDNRERYPELVKYLDIKNQSK